MFFTLGLHTAVDAPAVILSVQPVFVREFDRTLISVSFLEIGVKIRYIIFLAVFCAEFIQLNGILMRAYRKRGTEIFILKLFCKPCGFFKPHFIA